MRIEQLLLRAFGPFTDVTLDLSGGRPGGLHVIYGPNEAGKSTSLRAVRNFLFGMPNRSPDAHLHPSNKLVVGAKVSHGGTEFELLRLKRRRDDLVYFDGTPVTENPLPGLLGQLDERSFSLRFGLDQVELEKGAEALLGGSEQGLFSAGTAGADARRLLDTLDGEASALFLPRGKNPLLNKQSLEYEEAARHLKRAERPPEKWQEQEKAFSEAQRRATELRKERAYVRSELRRLSRIQSVISDLGEWETLSARAEELRAVVDLPPDARERRIELEQQKSEAEVEARRVRQELEDFVRELAELPLESTLGDIDDDQLQLSARIGTAIAARRDLPKRKAALLEVERQIAVLLRDLGRDVPAGKELSEARKALTGEQTAGAVRRLVTQRSGLEGAVRDAERRYREITRQLSQGAEEESQGPDAADLGTIEALLADARAALQLQAELERERVILHQEAPRLSEVAARYGISGSWLELTRLLPSVEMVRAAVDRFLADDRAHSLLQGQHQKLLSQLERLQQKRASRKDVPSEEMLARARAERDGYLASVDQGERLALETFVPLIHRADHIADRLRFEAERVAQVQALLEKGEELSAQIRETAAEMEQLEAAGDAAKKRYSALMDKLGVQNVPELVDSEQAIAQLHEWCRIAREQEARETIIAERSQKVGRATSELLAALARVSQEAVDSSGLGLSGAIAWGERVLREGLSSKKARELRASRERQLQASQEDTALELDAARLELLKWEKEWARAVHPLGLSADASIERAQEVLSTLSQIARLLEGAENLEGRIFGMDRDTEALKRDVRKFAAQHALASSEDEDPIDLALRLQDGIRSARRAREERARVKSLVEARRVALSAITGRVSQAAEGLTQLMKIASAKDLEELASLELASKEKQSVVSRVNELLSRIREASDGASPEELLEESREFQGAVRRLVVRIDELDAQSSDLEEALRDAESEAESMRLGLLTYKSQDVAILRQTVSERAASARATLREYLLLKAAHTMLKQEVERYAERFSGPIAQRAGELFARITLGKYSGLSIGVGEKTLRCVRQGHDIEVGELSRGTRAQLYFVLRVASLEHFFAEHDPVPLVFDDLFVDFDDDRTTVAFELLADLAQKTQILYFTHLARDVEKAYDAVRSDLLFSHTIGVS